MKRQLPQRTLSNSDVVGGSIGTGVAFAQQHRQRLTGALLAVIHPRTLATELTAWMQMLALAGTQARRWEPKRLRLRLFSLAGTIAHRSRRVYLHLSGHAPHRHLFTTGLIQLQALHEPT